MNKLTSYQIKELYNFVQNNGVPYYDLQTELVDHLANDIESQWQYNQNPDFDEALNAAYGKFSKNSFANLVAERKKALGKRYMKLITKYFITFFTLPKLMLTIALCLGWYYLMVTDNFIFGLVFLLMQITVAAKVFYQRKKLKGKVVATGRKWLLEEMIYNSATVLAYMGVSVQVYMLAFSADRHSYLTYALPVAATLFTLHNYIAAFIIPARAEDYLKETYPEYGLV